MDNGIAQFFYTRQLPADAVAIAKVTTDPAYAADLIDVDNVVTTGLLRVWPDVVTNPPFNAAGIGTSLSISGASSYVLESQFFELTDRTANGIPLYYKHVLDTQANSVTITDDAGMVIATDQLTDTGILYHSLDGALYWVRYIDNNGIVRKKMLKYDPVLAQSPNFPSATQYALSGSVLAVNSSSAYSIRFTRLSVFGISIPYGSLPNIPWFPRVRFPLSKFAPEWAAQPFNPVNPYLLASWVTGAVVDANIIQLQRPDIYPDSKHWPDILVFDKDYAVKYALEGTSSDVASRRGTSYPWKRGQIVDVDYHTARVQIVPPLAQDDIVFAFYSYKERDVLFTAIDCNPFTNPAIKNCLVRFYTRTSPGLLKRLYFQVIGTDPVTGASLDVTGIGSTNDPTAIANAWASLPLSVVVIGDLFVGASIGPHNLTITDARVRGGGLIPDAQSIEQAANFWDVGYIDGKPYPVGGALAVYLPFGLLDTMTRTQVQDRVNKTLPLGALAVIRYYDDQNQEQV